MVYADEAGHQRHQTKERIVSIESEAEKDLSLSQSDAENVTGGRMLQKLKNLRRNRTGVVHSKGLPTSYSNEPAVDPVADEEGQ
jgi:isopentenyl phosphate kinase